jgi:hypothetical protein
MNTSSPNPFTGLKGALAGLMSGGWLGLLFGLLFRRRIAPMLAVLEKLFEQFRAGTLPLPAAPVRPTARTSAGRTQAAASAAPRARCRPASRRSQVILAAAAPVRPAVGHPLAASRVPAPAARAPHPPPCPARCSKNAASRSRPGTSKLLRYQNN